jgi:hypothetical protein
MKKLPHSYIPRGSKQVSGTYAWLLQRLFAAGVGGTRSEHLSWREAVVGDRGDRG